jgi:NAD(P)-dependent dehydrogenase (short-subunit alcohol dehydrogenase family)
LSSIRIVGCAASNEEKAVKGLRDKVAIVTGGGRAIGSDRRKFDALDSLEGHGRPDDIAAVIAFLAGEESRYITGQELSVSGGLMMHG